METETARVLGLVRRVSVRDLRGVLALALLGSVALALFARIQVPLVPVPVTGQTLGLLLLGAFLGPRLGALAALFYLLEGAAGLPVFARGGGLGYLLGPTGGFLVAFPLAAYLVGWLFERGASRRALWAFLALLLGAASVYLVGLPWLALYLGVGAEKALALGLWPFVPGDLAKVLLATWIVRRFGA